MSLPSPNVQRLRGASLRALAPSSALGVALLLVACGGSNPATDAAARERASERSQEAKLAEFARCLREHGVQASTSPGPGGEGVGLKIGSSTEGGSQRTRPHTMEAAQKACQKYRPEPKKLKLSPQEKVKREEELLKFAKCMREHGINLHAEVSGGGIGIQIQGHPGSGPNPQSPAFQAAQRACSGYLPFKGGPRGKGPGQTAGGTSGASRAPDGAGGSVVAGG